MTNLPPLLDTSKHLPIADDNHDYRTFLCGRCGFAIVVPVGCGNRFCAVCRRRHRLRSRRRLEFMISCQHRIPTYGVKFLTLTIPNTHDLPGTVRFIIRAFRKFRNRRDFKRHVHGGAYVIEITESNGSWHVHIHALIYAKFWPINEISRIWESCSGGRIVWIKAVTGDAKATYLTKYVSKSSLSLEHQMYASLCLKSFRLLNPFGGWHAISRMFINPISLCPQCGGSCWVPDYLMHNDAPGWVPRL